MSVVRIAVDGSGSHKPAAAAGGRHTDFATELVALVSLALADALHGRLVNAVDFVLVMALLLKNAFADGQKRLEGFVSLGGFTLDIADNTPQIRA